MNVSFDLPWMLAVGALLALAAVLSVRLETRRRKERLARLGPESTLARIVPSVALIDESSRRPVRLALAVLLTGIALAGPRWGPLRGGTETQGIDVVFAVDASLSMLAHDDRPTRLERARQEARRLRALSRNDRVGLIAFAGRSYVLSPLTADDGALALFLDNLDPSIVGQPGSSIAAAVTQGIDLLAPSLGSDRAIVLFTDGESWDQRAEIVAAGRAAADAGVSIIAIGFGTERGSTILFDNDGQVSEKRDIDGNVVTTRYDADLLGALVDASGGVLVEANATDKASRARAALAELRAERRRVDARLSVPLRFQWFLAPALLLLLWDTIAVAVRGRVAATAVILVLFGPPYVRAQANRAQAAEEAYNQGRAISAVRLWRAQLESGDRSPQLLYNLGTAYLAADSLNSAIEILERAVALAPDELRNDALFNLGLAYLKRGRDASGSVVGSSFRSAARAYRSILLGNPGDADARWNYELALREEQSSGSSGGGGGGSSGQQPQQPSASSGELDREQAAQLLDAAAREESEVRARQRPPDRDPPRGRDW